MRLILRLVRWFAQLRTRWTVAWHAASLPDDLRDRYLARYQHRARVAQAMRRAHAAAMRDPEDHAPAPQRPSWLGRRRGETDGDDLPRRIGLRF